ncbi:MAG: hypothetical protein CL762_01100 [Chloroflexi bacterium]|nr:hypothetical protein [Chloroflexota bacterium]|tara:strand:- start:3054 stop:3272 length:219 start_codon:yes stop_codon:yes gene_type:complete
MAGIKKEEVFSIQSDMTNMLEYLANKYKLADRSKALRVILDYVAEEGDIEEIFSVRRCLRCGGRSGWDEPNK